MGFKIFPFEDWIRYYRAAGLRLIPVFGRLHDDGFFDEKDIGMKDWPNFMANDNDLLSSIRLRFKWSCVTGRASGNLFVVDYDLQKHFGSSEKAYAWRESHRWSLRDLDTVVTFTPSGGCHVWLSCPNGQPSGRDIDSVMYGTFPCAPDLIRGDNQQVLIPPSRIINKGYYLFLDQDEVLPDFRARVREVR